MRKDMEFLFFWLLETWILISLVVLFFCTLWTHFFKVDNGIVVGARFWNFSKEILSQIKIV